MNLSILEISGKIITLLVIGCIFLGVTIFACKGKTKLIELDSNRKFVNVQYVYGRYYVLTRLKRTNEVDTPSNTYILECDEDADMQIVIREH